MGSEVPENSQQAAASSTEQEIPTQPNEEQPTLNTGEYKLPTRKDVSLREFLSKIDDYAPIVRPLPSFSFLRV